MAQTHDERLSENAVALMASFPNRERFYKDNGPKLSGFQGCWNYVAKVARLFTAVEEATPAVWDESDWVRAIDYTANQLSDGLDWSDDEWMEAIGENIEEAGDYGPDPSDDTH